MPNYLYNGVALPGIPNDILKDNPFAIIIYDPDTSSASLRLAGVSWIYNVNATNMLDVGTGYYRQWYDLIDGEWVYNKRFGTQISATNLLWSNHDIMTNTASRDYEDSTLYFAGTKPILITTTSFCHKSFKMGVSIGMGLDGRLT